MTTSTYIEIEMASDAIENLKAEIIKNLWCPTAHAHYHPARVSPTPLILGADFEEAETLESYLDRFQATIKSLKVSQKMEYLDLPCPPELFQKIEGTGEIGSLTFNFHDAGPQRRKLRRVSLNLTSPQWEHGLVAMGSQMLVICYKI